MDKRRIPLRPLYDSMPLRSTRAFDFNRLLLIAILALLSYSVFYRNGSGTVYSGPGPKDVEQDVKNVVDPWRHRAKIGNVGKGKNAQYAVMSMNTKGTSYDYMAISSKDRESRSLYARCSEG